MPLGFSKREREEKQKKEIDKLVNDLDVKETDVYTASKSKALICHFMVNNEKEVGRKKAKIFDQDVTYAKRVFEIKHNSIITDVKGLAHIYFDMNETNGVLSFKKPWIDKCKACNTDMTGVDAMSMRNLVKRRTISALWSLDNTHTLLLLIMGLVIMILIGILFYFATQNQNLTGQLTALAPKPTPKETGGGGTTVKPPVTGHFILPVIVNER